MPKDTETTAYPVIDDFARALDAAVAEVNALCNAAPENVSVRLAARGGERANKGTALSAKCAWTVLDTGAGQ